MISILEYTPIAQFAIGADHRITHWNRACELLTGLSASDMIGTDRQWTPFYPAKRPVLADLAAENDFSRFLELYRGKEAGPSQVIPEAWQAVDFFKDLGGRPRHIFFLAAPVFEDTGNRIGAVETLQDVTQRVHAERLLQESEKRYRILTESVAEGIAVIQAERIVFANRPFKDLFDITEASDLTGRPALNFIARPDRSRMKGVLRTFRDEHLAEESMRIRCISNTGREFWADANNRVIRWAGQLAVLTTIRDVTRSYQRETSILEEAESLRTENARLRSSIRERYRFGGLVGKSRAMQKVYELILKAASSGAHVILYGESGTGKELTARAIHNASPRKDRPFVPVHCGAIPEPLIESEFFGHRKGAFTGAQADKLGFLDLADTGTLFLDEVGELPLSLQIKLLRALEGGGYTPLGSGKTRHPELHIIAATNRDLAEEVRAGRMREDFYYRIHVLPIRLPPLRDRMDDLPLLTEHFLRRIQGDEAPRVLPPRVMEALAGHTWPGNVRELQNVLQRHVTLDMLDLAAPSLKKEAPSSLASQSTTDRFDHMDLQEAVSAFERDLIQRHLDRLHWHRTQVAEALRISRKTLFRKIKHHGLNGPDSGQM